MSYYLQTLINCLHLTMLFKFNMRLKLFFLSLLLILSKLSLAQSANHQNNAGFKKQLFLDYSLGTKAFEKHSYSNDLGFYQEFRAGVKVSDRIQIGASVAVSSNWNYKHCKGIAINLPNLIGGHDIVGSVSMWNILNVRTLGLLVEPVWFRTKNTRFQISTPVLIGGGRVSQRSTEVKWALGGNDGDFFPNWGGSSSDKVLPKVKEQYFLFRPGVNAELGFGSKSKLIFTTSYDFTSDVNITRSLEGESITFVDKETIQGFNITLGFRQYIGGGK